MRLATVSTLIGLGALIAIVTLLYSFQALQADPQVFSRDKWSLLRDSIESDNDPGCVLGGPTKELLNRRSLNGKSKQYVVDQLGVPNREDATSLVYFIGQCHGWGWHHSELVISLAETGVVTHAESRRRQ